VVASSNPARRVAWLGASYDPCEGSSKLGTLDHLPLSVSLAERPRLLSMSAAAAYMYTAPPPLKHLTVDMSGYRPDRFITLWRCPFPLCC
jgi:hypothetical protein